MMSVATRFVQYTLLLFALWAFDARWSVQAQPTPGKPIEVIGRECDFGYIPFGSTVRHAVKLINHSDTTIKITRVNTGCGCTQMPLNRREMDPNDTLVIELILDTSKIHEGNFQKTPRIFTDYLNQPSVTMLLKGHNYGTSLRPGVVEIEPRRVEFKRGAAQRTANVRLTNRSLQTLSVVVAEMPDNLYFELSHVPSTIKAGETAVLTVKLAQTAGGSGSINSALTLAFDDKDQSRYTIPLYLGDRQ